MRTDAVVCQRENGGYLALLGAFVGAVGRVLLALSSSSSDLSVWIGAGVGNESAGIVGACWASAGEKRMDAGAGGCHV